MILITWPENLKGEHEFLNLLFEEGLEILHVRKPGISGKDLRAFLQGIKYEYHGRIMLHQGFALMQEFFCRGIHFSGQSKRSYKKYLNINGFKCWPVHGIEEIAGVPDGIDQLMLSPVFQSISKEDYQNYWEPGEPERHLKENKRPMIKYIALGGIDINTAPKALEMGFDDFAVLGAIWVPFISGRSYGELLQLFHKLDAFSKR